MTAAVVAQNRPPSGAAGARASAAEVLTLSRPQGGEVIIFDANDFAVIDLMMIAGQWAALVQVGSTLKIVFSDGAAIELRNFFSYHFASDPNNSDDHVGALPDSSGDLLVRTSASQLLSSEEFGRSYWITKTSSYLFDTSRDRDGGQMSPIEIAHSASDIGQLPSSPDLFHPISTAPFIPFVPSTPSPAPIPPPVNIPAVISGVTSGSVIEAGGIANATPGIPTATGDLNSTDVDNPPDAWSAIGTATASANGYGTYTLSASGVWTYTLNNSNAAVEVLNVGGTLTDTFTAATVDGTQQLVTITIHGTNDAAVISGTASGNVTEAGGIANGTPGIPTATGDLNSTDVDNPGDGWQAVPAGAATYGTYKLTAAGVWIYTLNDNNPTVQALNVGDPPLTDSFTALTADGTAQLVTITIHGTNDAAVISGVTSGTVLEAGGIANATPGIPTATGDLNSTDVDNLPDSWQAVVAGAATTNGYGSYALDADGVWTYTLDNSNAAVEALNVGGTLTDTFTAATVDGTQQLVTITISAQNDAAVISGTASGNVTEAGGIANGTPGMPTATGNLNSTDVDNPPDGWQAVPAGVAAYGTYALYSDRGVDLHAQRQQSDGAGAQRRRPTHRQLHGADRGRHRAARDHHHPWHQRRCGDQRHRNRQRDGSRRRRQRHARHADRHRRSQLDRCRQSARRLAGGSGRRRDRQWLRQLRARRGRGVDLHARQQQCRRCRRSMSARRSPTRFTAPRSTAPRSSSPSPSTAHNDAAVISGTTTGHRDGGRRRRQRHARHARPRPAISIRPMSTIRPTPGRRCGRRRRHGYGTYTLTATGVWTYTLDNSNPTVQALNVGDRTLTDSFTALTADGTAQVVTITINGTDDAAVISGNVTGDGDRGRRRRQRHAGHTDRDRRSQLDRCRQSARRLDGGRHGDRERQRLRHLHADRGRRVDLHARQQQCRGGGAQCRRDADRHVHRHHGRRHHAAGDYHHQRHQRRRR